MVIVYIIEEILFDIYRFLRFWFFDCLKFISNKYFDTVLAIEKSFSIRLNILNFFSPLFGDRSLPGYVYAPFVRITIIFIGLILQLFNFVIFLMIFLIWIFMPLILSYIVYKNG